MTTTMIRFAQAVWHSAVGRVTVKLAAVLLAASLLVSGADASLPALP